MDNSSCALNVPCNISLRNGIGIGTVVKIRGSVPDNSDRFEINLATSNCPDPDLALHFNPRFDENKVVLNTKENGVWCREECRNCVPFLRGQGFELMIIPKQEGFQIVVGDQEYYHFCYRIPLCEVCRLEVRGKVMLESVSIF